MTSFTLLLALTFAVAAQAASDPAAAVQGKPPAGSGQQASQPQGGSANREDGASDGGKGAPAVKPEDSAQGSLSAIQAYRIELSDREVTAESGSISEIVNLFPARRRRRFHGSIYEFHRNDNLDARNFFDAVGEPLPEFKRNQFGFNLGTSLGPLSLWGSYDGLRIIQGSTRLSHVPTPAQKEGDFSNLGFPLIDPLTGGPFAGNRIPAGRIDPVAQGLLFVFPAPNRDEPDRNFDNSQPRLVNRDSWEIRADYSIDEHNKLFVSYVWTDGEERDVEDLPGFGELSEDGSRHARLAYTWTAGPSLLVSAELNFWRWFNFDQTLNAGQEGLLDSIGIEGISAPDAQSEGFPEFDLSGYAEFGDSRSPTSGVNNTLSPKLAVTWVSGAHTLQMGGQAQLTQSNNNRSGGLVRGRFDFDGTFSGDAFADFLLGLPLSATRASGSDRIDLRGKMGRIFLQDQWKVNSKLDLTLGLAYNFDAPFRSVRDDVSTFFPLLFEPPLDGEIVVAGTPRAQQLLGGAGSHGLVFTDWNNWEPILALAYSPSGDQSLVLRTSYNVNYVSPDRGQYIRNLGRNYPFYFIESAQSSSDRPELSLASPFEAATTTELTFHGIDPHIRTAYVQRWDVAIQSEVIRRWNLEVAYRGEKGTHLTRTLPANIPFPGQGSIQPRRPHPGFGAFRIVTGSGSSIRHALNVQLNRRFAEGFSLRADFGWNRAINDLFRRRPGDPRNLAGERAPSSSEPRHRLTLNYIWDLPIGGQSSPRWMRRLLGGWRLSGITRLQAGRPFSVLMTGDPNNDGLSGERPDRVGSGRTGFVPSVDEWFDTTAFAEPQGTFGNAGRNILYAPGRQIWDLSLSKQARIGDSDSLEVRIEFFNAFNRANFERPDTTFGTSVFGTIFGAGRAREIEIALKYSF